MAQNCQYFPKQIFMQDEKKEHSHNNPSEKTGAHRGAQGIDKAPGKEDREGPIENVVDETQRGKNKVDGDPSQESDQPIDQS